MARKHIPQTTKKTTDHKKKNNQTPPGPRQNEQSKGKTPPNKPLGVPAGKSHTEPRAKHDPIRHDSARNTSHKHSSLGAIRLHGNRVYLYGRHTVASAIENSARKKFQLFATEKSLEALKATCSFPENMAVKNIHGQELDQILGSETPHQGVLLEASPLPSPEISDITHKSGENSLLLALDQVTDPHNIGACIRSAAAFGADALITTDRNSASESGTLAKSASGALEILPWCRTHNMVKAIGYLKEQGYWVVGLDGKADTFITETGLNGKIVLVMGAEGRGLRPLVAKHCDICAKIPISGKVESLNVSNAAAIALFALKALSGKV